MLYHKFDAETKVYTESVEAEGQPESSTDKKLPEITEQYTVAFINDEWISVLKPELEIVNNKITSKEVVQEEVVQEEV